MTTPKRALVTGGCGYIGSRLVDKLLENGWRVNVLDTGFTAKRSVFKGQVYMQRASVANIDAVARSMKDVSAVFHLAARFNENSDNLRNPLRVVKTNVEGTAVVLALAHAMGVDNVVMASTAAVYGELAGGEESDYTMPVDIYGATKLASEALGNFYTSVGINVKILRLFNVWGGCDSESVVNKFVKGEQIINGDGAQTRDFVYVEDAVNALYHAQVWDPGVYNIGTGEEVSISGLYHMLNNGKEPQFRTTQSGGIYRSFASTEATTLRTAWKPRILISELTAGQIKELCS
jgi:UDP-glucose 4-epimerase